MNTYDRDLLVLKSDANQQTFEKEIACLHQLLVQVECKDSFCTAHELATRLKITSKRKLIIKAASQTQLKPFHFLINKN